MAARTVTYTLQEDPASSRIFAWQATQSNVEFSYLLKVNFSPLQAGLSDFQAAHAHLPLKHVPVPYLYRFPFFAVWGFKASWVPSLHVIEQSL